MRLFWKHNREQDQTSPDTTRIGAPVVGYPAATESTSTKSIGEIAEWEDEFAGSCAEIEPGRLHEQIDVEAIVHRLTDRRTRIPRGLVYWSWIAFAPAAAFGLAASIVNGEFMWTLACIIALVTSRALSAQADLMRTERAARLNSHLDNQWIGPLSEALEWPARYVNRVAALLLTQFLPRLRREDTDFLTDEQRTCLYRRLTTRAAISDPALAQAVLQALPHIGTEPALPYVERLADGPALTPNGRALRNTARATLALLERRVARQRAAERVSDEEGSEARTSLVSIVDHEDAESKRAELTAIAALVDAQMMEFEAEFRRLQIPGMRIGYLIASWGVILPYCAVETYLCTVAGSWLGGLVFGVLTLLSTQLHRLLLTNQHKMLARRLLKMEDVRFVGRLAEALEWPDTTIRDFAIAALTRLLPRVKASDGLVLTARQRGNLHRRLVLSDARNNAEFLVSILRALGQVGDSTSVPVVERLARAQPISGRQRTVCDAAIHCLDYVTVRAELNRSSQTLLRASARGVTGPEMLVRPVNSPAITDRDELLRAEAPNGLGRSS